MKKGCRFLLVLILVNGIFGNRKTKNFETKRLLLNDPDVLTNLVNELQLRVKTLESSVNDIKQASSHTAIGFQAELSHTLSNLPQDTVVVFDTVLTNDGGGYNGTTGVFTCPDDGLYSFTWTTLTDPGQIFHTQFTVDGIGLTKSHNNAFYMQDGKTSTKNVVVHMTKGSKAWIKVLQSYGHIIVGDNWSSFAGFKI